MERSFILSDLPAGVRCVEAVFEIQPGSSGYVMCRIHGGDEWVVWRYYRNSTEPTGYFWGFYTRDREEALRNLFDRTGFGRVEALLDGEMIIKSRHEWPKPEAVVA